MSSHQHIHVPYLDITIYTDSSTLGWGVTDGNNPSGGGWKADEIIDLKAIFIGVQTCSRGKNYKHLRVMSDNKTAISYVNNKEEIKSKFCNEIAKKNYGCGVHHKICWYQLHTFLEHKILRQTAFLETSMKLLSEN